MRGLVLLLAVSGGCVGELGPVEPLSAAELGEPAPARPSLIVPFSRADADPGEDMTVKQHFPLEVVERDRGSFWYWRAPIWAPAARDRSDDRELARAIEATLEHLRWGAELSEVRSAVWTGDRLIALFPGEHRSSRGGCYEFVTVIAVFAPGVPEPAAMPEHAWQLHVDQGPFILSDGRLVYASENPLAQRVDKAGSVEQLRLPKRPAVLIFDHARGVDVVAELDLDELKIDEHDRIWAVVRGRGDPWLTGLRVDGRRFFHVELEGLADTRIERLGLSAEGPCVTASPEGRRFERCFALDGRPRSRPRGEGT